MPRGIVNEPQPTQSPRVFMNSRLLFENWSCLLDKHHFFFFVRSRQILQRPYNTGILQGSLARPSRASFCQLDAMSHPIRRVQDFVSDVMAL